MRSLIQAFVAGIAGAVTVVVLIGATSSIKTDGNVETDQQLVSNVPRGTSPLAIQSSTNVANLNADMVDGKDASAFALAVDTYTMAEIDALLATYRDSRRAFYLTTTPFNGDEADGTGVCDSGFHFASLFEILDVSNLKYDSALGETRSDSGQGPLSATFGWVRTGYHAGGQQANSNLFGDAGRTNCVSWTTDASNIDGTIATLNSCWQEEVDCNNPTTPTHEHAIAQWWIAQERPCSTDWPVWCVEDYPGSGG